MSQLRGLRPSQLPKLKPGSWISLDTEDSGLYPDDGARVSVVSVAWDVDDEIHPDPIVQTTFDVVGAAFPFAHGAECQPWFRGAFTLFGGDENINLGGAEWTYLISWLMDKRISMQNAQYDLIMMDAGVPEWAPGFEGITSGFELDHLVGWDTMLGAKNLWPQQSKNLADLAVRHKLGKKLGDPVTAWIRKHKAEYVKQGYPSGGSGYDLVPWLTMEEYAAEDAILTQKLRQVQAYEFAEGYGDWTEFVTKQMPVMKLFVKMERRGLPYGVGHSLEQVSKLEKRQNEVGKILPFTPTAAEAKRYYFTDERTRRGIPGLGLIPAKRGKPTKREPEGAPSLDADVLADMAEAGEPFATEWKVYTDMGRLSSMYYMGYAEKTGKDGRLRGRIKQQREETRESAGMGERNSISRVNLQAIPQDFKLAKALEGLDIPSVRQIIAREVADNYPEWRLTELDLSQAELRAGAVLAECKPMLKAFHEGADLHGQTAKKIGVRRQVGKISNFSLIFDAGWLTFKTMIKAQSGIKLSEKEAKNIVYPWKRMYPEYKRMADKWQTFVEENGYVPLVNGQNRWFLPREDPHKGWNQLVQSSIQQLFQEWMLAAEDICEEARVHEYAELEGIGGAGPLMCVHDSIICLLPEAVADELEEKIKAAAIKLWDEYFPGVPGAVDAKIFGS
jgi:DNA polymerase I-like protein with 3'-5' exonuclease and polymerase domains